MDNVKFNVNGISEEDFRETFKLFLKLNKANHSNREAKKYCISNGTLYLFDPYQSSPDEVKGNKLLSFPYKMNEKSLTDFVWNWLSSLSDKERNKESKYDDGDVWNKPAWRIYVETWGHILDRSDGIVAIEASWAWYGK